MLFLVFGSSASGKTFALEQVRVRLPELAVHDFDEIGVPAGATKRWRHEANEEWIGRALDYQARRVDLLLAGQTPLGELLATPSAIRLEAISACLVDCDDRVRDARLRARHTDVAVPATELVHLLNWAEWMRRHARDPTWRPYVLHRGSSDGMQWQRWSDWVPGDPRWRVHVVDTSELPMDAVADDLGSWIVEERALFEAGRHPLASWAAEARGEAP